MSICRKSKGLSGAAKAGSFLLAFVMFAAIALYVAPAFALSSLNFILMPLDQPVSNLHMGDSFQAVAQWDESPNATWVSYQGSLGSWVNVTFNNTVGNTTTAVVNLTNSSGSPVWTIGNHSIRIYANDSTGAVSSTTIERFTVWGWASLLAPQPGISFVTTPVSQGQNATVQCKVLRVEDNNAIGGYPVSFYINESGSVRYLGNSTTIQEGITGAGEASINFTAPSAPGTYQVFCNITDNATLYYNDTLQNIQTFSMMVNDTNAPWYDTGESYWPPNGYNVSLNHSIGLHVDWQDDVQLSQITLWTNETGAWMAYRDGTYGSPAAPEYNNKVWNANFNWLNSSIRTQGTVIQWAMEANDSSGNINMTANRTFVVRDLTAPSWSGISQNATIVHSEDAINLSSVWSDDFLLGYAWLSTNETGTWRNYTAVNISDFGVGPNPVSFEWQNSSVLPSVIGWRIYANDSVGNHAGTNESAFYSYGWSNITNASVIMAQYDRGSPIIVSCKVSDANSSSVIPGYLVNFYKDGSLVNSTTTNATGIATWNWNTTSDSVGNHTVSCNITNSSTTFYNATGASAWNATTDIIGALMPSLTVTPNIIYRNDSYSPHSTTFVVTMRDDISAGVGDVNVSFWNSTAIIGSCLTETAGTCAIPWNPSDIIEPNNYSISFNSTKQFYHVASNSTWVVVKGKLTTNITSIQSESQFFKTENITMNSSAVDENGNTVQPYYVNWTLNSDLMAGAACIDLNCSNATWYINSSFPLGQYTINSNASRPFYDSDSRSVGIEILGWSKVNASIIPASIQVNSAVAFRCQVADNLTNSSIPNYAVNFYNSSGMLGSSSMVSNSTGWATLNYPGWAVAGLQNITCSIGNKSEEYYYNSYQNSDNSTVMVYGRLSIAGSSEAPVNIYPGSSMVKMLKLNMTSTGETVNVTSLNVYIVGTVSAGNVTALELRDESMGLLASASSPSGNANLTPAGGLNITGSRVFYLTVNMSDTLSNGQTLGLSLNSGNITATGMVSNMTIVPSGSPYTSSLSSFSQCSPLLPPAMVSPSDEYSTQNSSVNFDWNPSASAASYDLRISSVRSYGSYDYNYTTSDTNYTWSAQEGVWWWWVKPLDAGGIEGCSADMLRKITVDRTPPAVSLEMANNSIRQPSMTLEYMPVDALSSSMSCFYTLDNVDNATRVVMNSTPRQEYLSGLSDGLHNVSINCTDLSGNSNVTETVFFTVDSDLPVQIASVSTGQSSADPGGYWLWSFNLTLNDTVGTYVRMKLANWTDGEWHYIGVSGNARMMYCNSSMAYCNTSAELNVYNVKNDYDESQPVQDMLDIDPLVDGIQTTVWLNMSIPIGSYPSNSYSTTYRFGLY